MLMTETGHIEKLKIDYAKNLSHYFETQNVGNVSEREFSSEPEGYFVLEISHLKTAFYFYILRNIGALIIFIVEIMYRI